MKQKQNLDNCIITEDKAKKIKSISEELVKLARKKYPAIPEKLWTLSILIWTDDDFRISLVHNKIHEGIEFSWHKNVFTKEISKDEIKIIK